VTTEYPDRPEGAPEGRAVPGEQGVPGDEGVPREAGVPRDPDPPTRATEVDKQEPVTPDEAPEPTASEVESARLLANQARPVLGAEGFGDERIDELASAFIAKDVGESLEEFLRWARAEGPARPPDRVL
jgi:hypothetical protein